MKIEDQLCSREQSEKLENLGVVTEAYFSHVAFGKTAIEKGVYEIMPTEELRLGHTFNAYSSAELMEMLPNGIKNKNCSISNFNLKLKKDLNDLWLAGYFDDFSDQTLFKVDWENPARSLADVLIFVLKNNHVKPEDLKL